MPDFYSVWEVQCLRNFPCKLKSEELKEVQQHKFYAIIVPFVFRGFSLKTESKIWQNLIYLIKKFFPSLLENNLKKSDLIKISKSSKKEHNHMHLVKQLFCSIKN